MDTYLIWAQPYKALMGLYGRPAVITHKATTTKTNYDPSKDSIEGNAVTTTTKCILDFPAEALMTIGDAGRFVTTANGDYKLQFETTVTLAVGDSIEVTLADGHVSTFIAQQVVNNGFYLDVKVAVK